MTEEQMVAESLSLVKFAIAKYVRRKKEAWRDIDDLYQDGCIGLLKAIRTYDGSLGYTFSTYAIRCILNHISNARRRNQIPTTSLDKVVGAEDGREITLLQLLPDRADVWDRLEDRQTAACAVGQIKSNARYQELAPVLLGRKTQQEFAEELGISRQAVQQRVSRFRQELKSVV